MDIIEHRGHQIEAPDMKINIPGSKISKIAQIYGAEAWFLRPAELATDESPKLPVIRHAFLEAEKHYGVQFDVLVDMDATSPLRNVEDIVRAYRQFLDEDAEILITACPARKNPYFNMVEKNEKGFLKLSKKLKNRPLSRQKAPVVYQLNGLYAYDAKKFLKLKKTDFSKSIPFEIPMETGIMIDTPFEFEIVRLILENKIKK